MDTGQSAQYIQPPYTPDVNYGLQNAFYNTSIVPPSASNVAAPVINNRYSEYSFQQNFQQMEQNKILDARPEILWERKPALMMNGPTTSNEYSAELIHGVLPQFHQHDPSKNYSSAETDAVSALTSLGSTNEQRYYFPEQAACYVTVDNTQEQLNSHYQSYLPQGFHCALEQNRQQPNNNFVVANDAAKLLSSPPVWHLNDIKSEAINRSANFVRQNDGCFPLPHDATPNQQNGQICQPNRNIVFPPDIYNYNIFSNVLFDYFLRRQPLQQQYYNVQNSHQETGTVVVDAAQATSNDAQQSSFYESSSSGDFFQNSSQLDVSFQNQVNQSNGEMAKSKKLSTKKRGYRKTPKKPKGAAKSVSVNKDSDKLTAKTIAVSTPVVAMPQVTQADGSIALSTAGIITMLARNADLVSSKKTEKNYISSLPSFYNCPSIVVGATTKLISPPEQNSASATITTTKPIVRENSFAPELKLLDTDALTTKPELSEIAHVVKIPKRRSFGMSPYRRAMCPRVPLWNGKFETERRLQYRLKYNQQQPICQCSCFNGKKIIKEDEGEYYTHLAASRTLAEMRSIMEIRFGEAGEAIRIEKVIPVEEEGKTESGCPIAKWVIRRSSLKEKVLCMVRERPGHKCFTAVICIAIVVWDGLNAAIADDLYDYLKATLPEHGIPTIRRCEVNAGRNCACQGADLVTAGSSFSFGCAWSMYYNACKFAKSKPDTVGKFKLEKTNATTKAEVAEQIIALANKCHNLADVVGPVYKKMAPAAYKNQSSFSKVAQDCRLGKVPYGPFSGITACADFSAHSHHDDHNMNNGCTVVVTLTKHRLLSKPDDEQLHVLPKYKLAATNEFGINDRKQKEEIGALEVLDKYPMTLRIRNKGLPCAKKRKELRKKYVQQIASKQTKLNEDAVDKLSRLPGTQQFYEGNAEKPNFHCHLQTNLGSSANIASWQQQHNDNFADLSVKYQNLNVINGQYWNANFYDPNIQNAQLPFAAAAVGNGQSTYGQMQSTECVIESNVNVICNNIKESTKKEKKACSKESGIKTSKTKKRPLIDATDNVFADSEIHYEYVDNKWAFEKENVGGVAIALSHGSVLFEVAKRELHATTALKEPNIKDPKRISLVFYQHKRMNYENHGKKYWEKREKEKAARKLVEKAKVSLSDLPVVRRLPIPPEERIPKKQSTTITKSSHITVSAKNAATCKVSGKYALKQ